MKAIAVDSTLPTQTPECFTEIDIAPPTLGARDLLVRVRAVSVNPADYKVRSSVQDQQAPPRILGWDAAGVVEQVGAAVSLFQPGDEVYYAGSITRPGSNSELHAVDERIVGHKPAQLSFEQAAALPLTTITAWEALFDRMAIAAQDLKINRNKRLLIIGGAGGVGSIAIQLAKRVAGLTVIATASRPETVDWCLKMGADYTINHRESFKTELEKIGIQDVDYILCLNDTEQHLVNMAETIKPQGKICSIVETEHPLDMNLLKNKSVMFAWESMFTRSMYETDDMQAQYDLLNNVSVLVDQQVIQSTMTEHFGALTPQNLAKAHAQLEFGRTIGKLVLTGFVQ